MSIRLLSTVVGMLMLITVLVVMYPSQASAQLGCLRSDGSWGYSNYWSCNENGCWEDAHHPGQEMCYYWSNGRVITAGWESKHQQFPNPTPIPTLLPFPTPIPTPAISNECQQAQMNYSVLLDFHNREQTETSYRNAVEGWNYMDMACNAGRSQMPIPTQAAQFHVVIVTATPTTAVVLATETPQAAEGFDLKKLPREQADGGDDFEYKGIITILIIVAVLLLLMIIVVWLFRSGRVRFTLPEAPDEQPQDES